MYGNVPVPLIVPAKSTIMTCGVCICHYSVFLYLGMLRSAFTSRQPFACSVFVCFLFSPCCLILVCGRLQAPRPLCKPPGLTVVVLREALSRSPQILTIAAREGHHLRASSRRYVEFIYLLKKCTCGLPGDFVCVSCMHTLCASIDAMRARLVLAVVERLLFGAGGFECHAFLLPKRSFGVLFALGVLFFI